MEREEIVKLIYDIMYGKVEVPLELSGAFNRFNNQTLKLMTDEELRDMQEAMEQFEQAERNGDEIEN